MTMLPRLRFPILALLLAFSPAPSSGQAALPLDRELRVFFDCEEWICDHDYLIEQVHRTPPKVGGDTIIILRNQDIVRHGFTSSALPQLYLRVEGEGVSAYGKGLSALLEMASTDCTSSGGRPWWSG